MRERKRRHDDAHFPMGGKGRRAFHGGGAPTAKPTPPHRSPGGSFGPYYAILNPDGSIRCAEDGDPYVFAEMGPHDNHSKHGRRVVAVRIEVIS